LFAPNLAKLDCEIVMELASVLGFNLGFKNSEELINLLDQEINLFDRINSINKSDNDCLKPSNDNFKLNNNDKIIIKNYDYYLTNSIARSSRILHKCSAENQ
jgi:NADH dehydrogenase/NADH:ubiquinone oxidoreductase subunit G